MSQPAAPSHESLPETYVDRNDAIKAIRGFAKSTGHQIVLSNRCPKGITFRCKGYKTPGAETFECEFKVCVFRKTVDGITSSSWTLNHRSQTWEHTCPVAGSASGRPTAQRVLTPSMALASAIAAPGSRVQSGATSGTTPRPMDDTSSSTEYVPMGMQVGFTRPTMVALQSSAAAAPIEAPGTTPHPHNGVRKLHNGKYECCFCIAGSGKAQGHGGRHKTYANISQGQKQR
jgi:hypothetical protein